MAKFNLDGFMNIFSALGTKKDPAAHTQFSANPIMTSPILEAIYRSDGLGRRIVQRPAEDICREWIELQLSDDKELMSTIMDELEVLRAKQKLIEAIAMARLYGGSIILAVTDEPFAAYSRPLRDNQEIVGFKVFTRDQIARDQNLNSTSAMKMLDGLPEYYRVSTGHAAQQASSGQIVVHETRCHVVQGSYLPGMLNQLNDGWGDSALQAAWDALARFGSAQGYSANIMREFSQSVLAVKGLTDMVKAGREDVAARRLNMLDMSKSILNTMLIDADGEEYSRNSTSVAGLAELLDRFAESLSAATNIPMTVLMGRSPGGMNSTGDSDLRIYYDFIASEQERVATSPMEWMLTTVMGSRAPEKWSFIWKALNQPTEKEVWEGRKLVADTDKIYLDAGVVSAEEIAESRWGSGDWSPETKLIDATERAEFASQAEPPDPVAEAAGIAAATAGLEKKVGEDAEPSNLYVSRKLANVSELKAWAKAQGIELQDDLHVTICYSKAPVDWMAVGTSWDQNEKGQLEVAPGGARMLDRFGPDGKHNVLLFSSNSLQWRHREFLEHGASHDWGDYQPHITLNATGSIPAGAEPYRGRLVFGPEIFEEIEED